MKKYISQILESIKPIKVYETFDRTKILKDQKGKTGIYMFVNLINGHKYVGKSINISERMRSYSSISYLMNIKNKNMLISRALLKHKHSNFALFIIKYSQMKDLKWQEEFYIDSFDAEYNIQKISGSSLGTKHTLETRQILSIKAKSRKATDTTKALISKAMLGENNPFYGKKHKYSSKIKISDSKSHFPIYLYNSYKELLFVYSSATGFSKLIKSTQPNIVKAIEDKTLFRGEWYIHSKPLNANDIPLLNLDSIEFKDLINEIINNSHVKKAIFVYNLEKELIFKFDSIKQAKKVLKMSHTTIGKHILFNIPYNSYIFSYHRI